LRPILNSLWSFSDLDGDGNTHNSEMSENADAAAAILQKHLGRFMLNEDVASQPPVELSIGFNGRVIVQDGHPDKEKIEKFINDNSELRNLYVGICNTKSFLAMAEEAQRFQRRYAVDPQAAVAEFSHLFSDNYGYDTRLVINDNSWKYQTSSSFSMKA